MLPAEPAMTEAGGHGQEESVSTRAEKVQLFFPAMPGWHT